MSARGTRLATPRDLAPARAPRVRGPMRTRTHDEAIWPAATRTSPPQGRVRPRPCSAQRSKPCSVAPRSWWSAPTGSGKTAAVMLPLLARPRRRTRRAPARSGARTSRPVRALADGHGCDARRDPCPKRSARTFTVGVRTGDTSDARPREAASGAPPDVLITTPESLAVMLATDARDPLAAADATWCSTRCTSWPSGKRGALLAATLRHPRRLRAQLRRLPAAAPRPLGHRGLAPGGLAALGGIRATRVLAVQEGALRPVPHAGSRRPCLDPYPPGRVDVVYAALPTLARAVSSARPARRWCSPGFAVANAERLVDGPARRAPGPHRRGLLSRIALAPKRVRPSPTACATARCAWW
jgi:hypothetical protein